jgi:hypothetical protein
MLNDTRPGRWFRRLLWVAAAANVVIALPAIAAPSAIVGLAGLPAAAPEIWPRLAALQVIVLSAFYVPPAIDLDRYRLLAWFAVAAHAAGGIFFLFEPGYRLFALYDFGFALPLAALLTLAVRRDRPATPPAPAATL